MSVGGDDDGSDFRVKEYATLAVGGLVLVLDDPELDLGLRDLLQTMDETHFFVPGYSLFVRAPASLVIENAFDAAHFRPVHGVLADPKIRVEVDRDAPLTAAGTFELPPSLWQRSGTKSVCVPFRASAFSPHVVATAMGGPDPYTVITCATPSPEGCIVRLSLLLPPRDGGPPLEDDVRYLLDQTRAGLELDRRIWENLITGSEERLTPEDQAPLAFRTFCERFM